MVLILIGLSTSIFIIFFLPKIDFSEFGFNNNSTSEIENATEPIINNTINNSETPENTPPCEENWTCANWSICINNTKTRECTDINSCNTTTNKSKTSEECCLWVCENWSECYFDDIQFRKCETDENDSCEITEKPLTQQPCNYTNPCTDDELEINYTLKGIVIDKNGVSWEDNCEDETYLTEYSCDRYGTLTSTRHLCKAPIPYCRDGICTENMTA